MSHPEIPPITEERFRSFVEELAADPDRSGLVARMRVGHEPDQHGWCRHPGHAHHWERHPCPTLRLAALVELADPPR